MFSPARAGRAAASFSPPSGIAGEPAEPMRKRRSRYLILQPVLVSLGVIEVQPPPRVRRYHQHDLASRSGPFEPEPSLVVRARSGPGERRRYLQGGAGDQFERR